MIKNEDLTVEALQNNQPWVVPYSSELRQSLHHMPHLLASHTVLHALKSLGKIAAVFESVDHRGGGLRDSEVAIIRDMAADLFTAALRLANLYRFSLVSELRRRVFQKNGRDVL